MRKWALAFPLLVISLGLLMLYVGALVAVSPAQFVRVLAELAALFAILAPLLNRLMDDWDLTAISLGILALALLFEAPAVWLVAGSLLLLFLIWGLYSFLFRRPGGMKLLTGMLCAATALFNVGYLILLAPWFDDLRPADYVAGVPPEPKVELAPVSSKPDIYFIVVDGYARADTLRGYYGFDNSDFTEYLQSRGFVVAAQARSNYAKTVLSIGSALNLDYADQWAPQLTNSPFWWTMVPYLRHSRLDTALEQEGYESYATASDWGITDNPTADHYFHPYAVRLDEFEGFVLSSTLLGRLAAPFRPLADIGTYTAHRAFLENDFSALDLISKRAGPKFVFVHITAPHPPFVYASDGSPLNPDRPFGFADGQDFPDGEDAYRRLYVGQLQYLNGRLETVIDQILSNSSIAPIIVLQADHGPGMMANFLSESETCMNERFSILGAYKLPGRDASLVPTDISPVNVFRLILAEYFGANLPLLENRNYYFADPLHILRALDVTDRVDAICTVSAEP